MVFKMTLAADLAADLATFFDTDEFAKTITYTPSGGAGVSISAIREEMDPSIMSEAPPGDSMTLLVKSADVTNPQRGDAFTIDSEIWYLIRNLGGGSIVGTWKLEISRSDKRHIYERRD
jgi:hypothetical protein